MEEDDALFVHENEEPIFTTTTTTTALPSTTAASLSTEASTAQSAVTITASMVLQKITTEIQEIFSTSTLDETTLEEFSSTTGTEMEDQFTTDYPNEFSTSAPADTVKLLFSNFDYTIFALMLASSSLIGVYFGFISKRKQNNTTEYLLGGKTMNKFPVSASLIATHVSGITLLGVPSEMYANGTQYWAFVFCAVAVSFAMIYVYLPVFYELQLTSSFTYLEKRFDKAVRSTASFVYAISVMIYIPIVIYVPALAFNQVTGINVHLITPVLCVVCIFYTTFGGLRAVVWADTLQFILMVAAILAVIFLGLTRVGGLANVWEAAERGGRLIFFNLDPNPLLRQSFWTVTLGLTTMWIANLGVSQGCIQRFLAVPDIKVAQNSVIIFTIGLIFIKSCSIIIGLIMYTNYETCDPVSTGKVKKLDQILPYYVMDVAAQIPGLPGLFVAGIFSAALSTLSSSLNTLAGTLYEDFIRHRYPNATEKTASTVMKSIVVILGVIVISLVFLVERMGDVLHMAISLSGVTAGALLGMFTMGMTLRKANTKGVIIGSIASVLAVGAILVGAQAAPKHPWLPLRVDGCEEGSFNASLPLKTKSASLFDEQDSIPAIFRISYMYYALVGFSIVFVIGYPVSLFTGGNVITDERLLTPLFRNRTFKGENLKQQQYEYKEIAQPMNDLKLGKDGEEKV